MSGTHGTPLSAGGDTGEKGERVTALASLTRRARGLVPESGVITDHARLRTYECGLSTPTPKQAATGQQPNDYRSGQRLCRQL